MMRQQAARKRDKAQKDIPYQLRSKGAPSEPELSEEEMFKRGDYVVICSIFAIL